MSGWRTKMETDPVLTAMSHPQYRALLERVFMALTNEGWPVDNSARFEEWRHTAEEWIPPFAFYMRWHGEEKLSPDQDEWLRKRQAFGHVRGMLYERPNGERFTQRHLVVFDMPPQPKPAVLYHATPTKCVASIQALGLLPGRLTGVNTTKFDESHRWVHLFEAREHATQRFLLLSDNKGRIPPGAYTILQVDSAGIGELFCDPFSPHGFVIFDEGILPHHIIALDEVTVA